MCMASTCPRHPTTLSGLCIIVSVSCTRMLGFSQHSAGAQSAAEQPLYQAVRIVVWTGLEVSRMLVALSVCHAVTPVVLLLGQ